MCWQGHHYSAAPVSAIREPDRRLCNSGSVRRVCQDCMHRKQWQKDMGNNLPNVLQDMRFREDEHTCLKNKQEIFSMCSSLLKLLSNQL